MWSSLSVFALAVGSALAATYPITEEGVKCRSGPATNHDVVKVYAKGELVSIDCQVAGMDVFGTLLWDKTGDGCFVTDYYVKTGVAGYVARKCAAENQYCKQLNRAGVALVKQWEGFVASPSPDPIGLPTVGYGHLCKEPACAEVKYPLPLTEATATRLLQSDLRIATACLGAVLNQSVHLNINQWAALSSWIFNVGCAAVGPSQLVKRLNNGEDPNVVAPEELPKWKLAGGQVLEGLVARRKAEIQLFLVPSAHQAHPQCK
ncbi:hypothetical protein H4R19_001894 [Coemansia spiralis]|nr:hypothetical protein H4R19_001894 [Coemansia spiralis]